MDYQAQNRFVPTKKEELAYFAQKEWGHEEWIVNNEQYCGKKLFLKTGFRCSMHHHRIKDETFYVISGKVFMETEYDGVSVNRVMSPGDVMHIKIGMWHRFTGLQDSEIIEFSTFHREDDSYRREVSGAVDLASLGF